MKLQNLFVRIFEERGLSGLFFSLLVARLDSPSKPQSPRPISVN